MCRWVNTEEEEANISQSITWIHGLLFLQGMHFNGMQGMHMTYQS